MMTQDELEVLWGIMGHIGVPAEAKVYLFARIEVAMREVDKQQELTADYVLNILRRLSEEFEGPDQLSK